MSERRCPVCGTSLEGRRPQARYCKPACQRLDYRIAKLRSGRPDGPYATLAE